MTTRRNVSQLAQGDAVDEVFLVTDKQLRTNRQGSQYLHLGLRDRTGTLDARLWNANEAVSRRFEPGDYLHVRGKIQLFQGALQLIVSHLDVADAGGLEPSEFLPQGGPSVPKLEARLRQLLFSMDDPHLLALAQSFLIDDEFLRKFTAAPAGVRNHHAYPAGLLEHVVTMLELADRIAPLYPEVHRDLLLAGTFLHDVGKVDELCYERGYSYSDEGQLVGHLVMGVAMLRAKLPRAADLTGEPFPDELRLRLEHMIVSHHGSHEFGSPKPPMTPEAVALHLIDTLDARLHAVLREIRDDPGRDSSWTPFNPALGRRLFKGLPSPAALPVDEA